MSGLRAEQVIGWDRADLAGTEGRWVGVLLIELQQGSNAPFEKASQMPALHETSRYQKLHASAA